MEIEGDDGGFSKSRFEMRPVVSDQPGKNGRGWPLPVKEVVATNPFISDRGSFSQKDLTPSLLAAQNLAGSDPATNFCSTTKDNKGKTLGRNIYFNKMLCIAT